ncbi:MAG: hypothetical protein IT449_10350 [Phycisphaerales bacterium]|nr:hypothetical protein [Phycisphaerales bacterium]
MKTFIIQAILLGFLGIAAPQVFSEVLLDNLCIVDAQIYDRHYISYCGMREFFGLSYSLEAADRFSIRRSYFITRVTVDQLTAYGRRADSVCIRFFEQLGPGCTLNEEPYCAHDVGADAIEWDVFEDTVYGDYMGLRLRHAFSGPCRLPANSWYLSVQPAGDNEYGAIPGISFDKALNYECVSIGNVQTREGRDDQPCCSADGDFGLWKDWTCDGAFETDTLSMRIEGIPAGDCADGERLRAKCKVRDGERVGDVVVKVLGGQPNGGVTALLDPPDPRSMSISLDGAGRGKGKFRSVPLGEHRVFVCDSIVDVTCAP